MKFIKGLENLSKQEITLKKLIFDPPLLNEKKSDFNSQNHKIIILDTETTGLDVVQDEIIEIAFQVYHLNLESGKLEEQITFYQELQEPRKPLSPIIEKITGLKTSDLHGKKIDWKYVEMVCGKCDFIISHNADFDRQFISKYFKLDPKVKYLCSCDLIDWEYLGFGSRKLELICLFHGFYYDSHRAMSDVNALSKLIELNCEILGRTYLKEILLNSELKYFYLEAHFAPFEKKDLLKQRGYRWEPNSKLWKLKVSEKNLDVETQWISKEIYTQANRSKVIPINN